MESEALMVSREKKILMVTAGKVSEHLAGYIRVQGEGLTEVGELLTENPVFECGGDSGPFGSRMPRD